MGHVVPDVDVLTEQLSSDAVVEERALIENRLAGEVPEHEPDDIEHRGRLEDHGVLPCRKFPWYGRLDCLAGRGLRERERIEVARVGRVSLLPAGGILREHRDGNFGRSLRVPITQTTRIEDAFDGFGTGKNAGRGQLVVVGDADNLTDALSAIFGSDRGSFGKVPPRNWTAAHPTIGGHRQEVRVRMLNLGQVFGGSHDPLQTFVVEFVGRGTRSPSAKYGAH